MNPHHLNPDEIQSFITVLDEKPEHTVSIHQLRNDLAKAFIIGDTHNFQAAVVQWSMWSEYLLVFGDNAEAIWSILATIMDWERVQVSQKVAPQLQTLMQADLHVPVTRSSMLYFEHSVPISLPEANDAVTIRLLTEADIEMVNTMPADDRPIIRKTLEATLRYEKVAGAIVDNRLVGFAESRAGDKHVEIGVFVVEAWRNHGIASRMAQHLIQTYQPTGLKIIWATNEDNQPSRRVAEKLGFQEIMRREFLIPQRKNESI